MDFVTFIKEAVVGSVPLILVVIGLVEWIKKLGVEGKSLTMASMGIGTILGAGYIMYVARPASGPDWWPIYVYWFAAGIFGLAMGIVASGLYDAVKKIIETAIFKASILE